MCNTSKDKRSVVRMMNKLDIDDKTCASFQPVPSMTFVNQTGNQFAHQQQKQHRLDWARFFYQLRQKRK